MYMQLCTFTPRWLLASRVGKSYAFFEKNRRIFFNLNFLKQNKLLVYLLMGGRGMLTFHPLSAEIIIFAVILKFFCGYCVTGPDKKKVRALYFREIIKLEFL